MAETKERRRTPRKNRSTLKPDSQAGNARMDASPEEIRRLIEEAAYYRAAERGIELSKDAAREIIYGMPYRDWQAKHQKEASPAAVAAFEKAKPQH